MTVVDSSGTTDTAFEAIVHRLSRQSVDKHFDAYADVPWDDPECRIDPSDPRWRLPAIDALGHTAWYRAQGPELQSRIALHRIAACMRIGWEFENILQRGLLNYAMRLPNGVPEFRYVHHEIVEESQHTMMFQEFVNRTGLPVRGIWRPQRIAAERVVIPMARRDPALFFLFVLGGEDPVDHLQRQQLRAGVPHPCWSGSCGSTSPRRPATSPSPATSCAPPYQSCPVPGGPRSPLLLLCSTPP